MLQALQDRAIMITESNNSPELHPVFYDLCSKDILYWFRNFVYTDRNSTLYDKDLPNEIPFIPYEFQEEMILEIRDAILNGDPIFLEKSRQMWASWVIMWIFVYWWNFHNMKFLALSQKQDDVDELWDMRSLFEKARFIINKLPVWMLPKWFNQSEDMSYMRITRPWSTWSITWESANPNASRWGTYDAIFADEFAFMSNATIINKAMASASACRIYTSTPNGKGNEHYRMRELAMPKDGSEPVIKWLRYHRTDHPLYSQERYKKKTASMDAVTIAQELEIDYDTAVKGRVYSDFPKDATDVIYDPSKPLFIAIDNSHWGTDPNAVLVAQQNGVYWNIIDCIEFRSTPIDSAHYLRATPKMQMNNIMDEFMNRYKEYDYTRATFISDPYDTMSAMWNSTILDDYKSVWINLMLPQERSKKEQILKTRTNLYRIRYNKNCEDFAWAILNAKYPVRKEDSMSTKPFVLPVHDWTSHYRTAFEYLITYWLENPLVDTKKNQILEDTRPVKDYLWRMVYHKTTRN